MKWSGEAEEHFLKRRNMFWLKKETEKYRSFCSTLQVLVLMYYSMQATPEDTCLHY